MSLTLLLAAAGIPRFLPNISPRRVVRLGLLAMLAGLGIGALASQLGAVTVSAVPDEDSPEVGGLQAEASEETATAVLVANRQARLDGLRAALVVLAGIAVLALFAAWRIPTQQPGSAPG